MKKIFAVFMCVFCVLGLSSCGEEKSVTGIRAFGTADLTETKFYCGSITGNLSLKIKHRGNPEASDIKVVIGDESVIKVDFKVEKKNFFSTYINFEVTNLKEGKTDFHFETIDEIVKSQDFEIEVLKNVKGISFKNQADLTLFKGEVRHDNYFEIDSCDTVAIPEKIIECVSEDPQIATVEHDESYKPFCCKINCFRLGETYIYLRTKDGDVRSEKVKITVRMPNEDDVFDRGKVVYITPNGKKYHYDRACAGKNAIDSTENTAVLDYEPCRRCAR